MNKNTHNVILNICKMITGAFLCIFAFYAFKENMPIYGLFSGATGLFMLDGVGKKK